MDCRPDLFFSSWVIFFTLLYHIKFTKFNPKLSLYFVLIGNIIYILLAPFRYSHIQIFSENYFELLLTNENMYEFITTISFKLFCIFTLINVPINYKTDFNLLFYLFFLYILYFLVNYLILPNILNIYKYRPYYCTYDNIHDYSLY